MLMSSITQRKNIRNEKKSLPARGTDFFNGGEGGIMRE